MILGVPTGGSIRVGYFDSCMRDMKSGLISGWMTAQSIYLDNNRNNIVSGFLKNFPNEQLLAQIDDDIYWDEMVIPELLKHTEKHDIVFPDLSLGSEPTTAWRWDGAQFVPHWPHPSTEPFETDGCAGAFFIVKRSVYELMRAGEWFDRRMINGKRAGEDMSFSDRLREMGIKPWCVPGLPILHFRVTPLVSPLIQFIDKTSEKSASKSQTSAKSARRA